MCEILKVTAHWWDNSFFFRKLFSIPWTSSKTKGYYAIVLKFSVKQIHLIRKKSVSTICKITNINRDFRIFVDHKVDTLESHIIIPPQPPPFPPIVNFLLDFFLPRKSLFQTPLLLIFSHFCSHF